MKIKNKSNIKLQERLKYENGSITLFVSIACIFIIIALVSINIGIISQNTNQEKQLEQILKNYAKDSNYLESVYEKNANENKYPTENEVKQLIQESMKEMVQQAKLEIYPVGSIYISTTSTNPGDYLGGKWESYAQGRTLVGTGTSDRTFTAGQTGGESAHTLSIAEMPSHNHGYYMDVHKERVTGMGNSINPSITPENSISPGWGPTSAFTIGERNGTFNITYTGGSGAHNNLQPYIVTYIWKRIQ